MGKVPDRATLVLQETVTFLFKEVGELPRDKNVKLALARTIALEPAAELALSRKENKKEFIQLVVEQLRLQPRYVRRGKPSLELLERERPRLRFIHGTPKPPVPRNWGTGGSRDRSPTGRERENRFHAERGSGEVGPLLSSAVELRKPRGSFYSIPGQCSPPTCRIRTRGGAAALAHGLNGRNRRAVALPLLLKLELSGE